MTQCSVFWLDTMCRVIEFRPRAVMLSKRGGELWDLQAMLLDSNQTLTPENALQYAALIIEAELREDYEQMLRLIQEALYAPKCQDYPIAPE